MPKFAANITMLFTEHPFIERIAVAKKSGFKAIECLFPYEYDAKHIANALSQNHMTQVLFNLPAGNWTSGDRGIAAIPDKEDEFLKSVEQAFKYAKALKCNQLHVMSGLVSEGANIDTYKKNIAMIAPRANTLGLNLMIEPLNHRDVPNYLISRTEDAVKIITELGFNNVKLQFDIYHRQIMQGDVISALRKYLPLIGHIQIAASPDRHEPDTGELDYPTIFKEIDVLDYEGWIGCEYNPKTTTFDGLDWLSPYQGPSL